MKLRLVSLITLGLAAASCDSNPRLDRPIAEVNASRVQLLAVFSALSFAEMEFRNAKLDYDGVKCACRVTRVEGVDYFRCAGEKSAWLRIRPDSEMWRDMDRHSEAVAAFNPRPFIDRKTKHTVYFAVTFGGKLVSLARAPDWKAVPVWELERTVPVTK